MKDIRGAYRFVKEKYTLLSVKKYTTIAGTLVFFLIMSIVPFSFWLTLLIGRLPITTDELFSLSVFASVKNVLVYVQEEAKNATAGASILLLITTLYSATNLFYQMRKSGELIYDYRARKQGLRMRFGALVLMLLVMATSVLFLGVFAMGGFVFSRLLPPVWETVADYVLLVGIAFLFVLFLNAYICPYKEDLSSFLFGTALTVGLWVIAVVGFSVYLKIGNVGRLYGTLSAVIVFLLWLYVLMICFIIGVIINSERILKKRKEDRLRKRKQAEKRSLA